MLARSACESSCKDKCSASISSGRAMPLFQAGLAFSYQRGRKTWSFKRILYYANTTATFQILLKSGDIEVNPGPEAVTNGTASVATKIEDKFHLDVQNVRKIVRLATLLTMSETWLKDNELLLQHITISGYCHTFQNRERMRRGGVGMYLKESLKFKRKKDIESRYPNLEHLCIEIPGRNKNRKLLIGTIHRCESQMNFQDWVQDFKELLSDLTIS